MGNRVYVVSAGSPCYYSPQEATQARRRVQAEKLPDKWAHPPVDVLNQFCHTNVGATTATNVNIRLKRG